jgi:hypothetical protein
MDSNLNINNFDQKILMENILILNQHKLLDLIIHIFENGYLSDKKLEKNYVMDYLNQQKFINWELFLNLINLESCFIFNNKKYKSIFYLIENKSNKLINFLLDLSLESNLELINWNSKLEFNNLLHIIFKKMSKNDDLLNLLINLFLKIDKYKNLLEEKDNSNNTPIFYIISKCSESIILRFLEFNLIELDWVDNFSNTLVHYACKKNFMELFNYLVLKTIDLDKKNKEGITPLHLACIKNNFNIVKILIEKNVNLESISSSNNKPINYAIKYGNMKLVKLLLEQDVILIYDQQKIFYEIIQYQNEDMIQYFLNNNFCNIRETNIFSTIYLYMNRNFYKQMYYYSLKKLSMSIIDCINDLDKYSNEQFINDINHLYVN